jgi:Protein of unknown function
VEREIPTIVSELRWDQVRLEPPLSEKDVDDIIFPFLTPHWRKVAMVIAHALVRIREQSLPLSDEIIAARIEKLVESDRLEGNGDLRMWRFSEVRLKD